MNRLQLVARAWRFARRTAVGGIAFVAATLLVALAVLGLSTTSGCGAGDAAAPGSAPAKTSDSSGPTYYADVEPILHERCTRCHQPNNLAPFSLLTLDDVLSKKHLIADAVAEKIMPPMPAAQGGDCAEIDDLRVMPQAEREVIRRWMETGAAVGDPKPARAALSGDGPLGPPTHTFPNPLVYEAPSSGDDDYRCFVIDPKLSDAVGVAAVGVQPGTARIVHHATAFLVPPEGADAVRALDDADPGAGYSCFGGPGTPQAYPAGTWVPGMTALRPPRAGLGGWLLPKWLMVLQVHYNFANGRGTDRSSIVAWQAPEPIVEVPSGLILGDWAIVLPPGQKNIVRSVTGDIVSLSQGAQLGQVTEGLIYAVWAHEHLLGKSFRMDLVHADGSSQCLLSIPRWDFHWQGIYRLKNPVDARAGEHVRVTCAWDNTAESQPVVDGARKPPREVRYGETTADEMCIGTLAVMRR